MRWLCAVCKFSFFTIFSCVCVCVCVCARARFLSIEHIYGSLHIFLYVLIDHQSLVKFVNQILSDSTINLILLEKDVNDCVPFRDANTFCAELINYITEMIHRGFFERTTYY